METNHVRRGRRRFAAAAALVMACVAGLAFWYTAPSAPPPPAPVSAPEPLRDAFRVDLNTAGLQALTTLPGIGEQKARAILEYRSIHGRFGTLAQVAQVPGITEDMITDWQGLAYVS